MACRVMGIGTALNWRAEAWIDNLEVRKRTEARSRGVAIVVVAFSKV
jgi:hypothetical protein